MIDIPGHTFPNWSEDARDDALFHYTSADGLIGIIQNKEIWGTAYYCTNDETELSAGKGILTPMFGNSTYEMIRSEDPMIRTFYSRGIDPQESYARTFEGWIVGMMLNQLSAYITCFCKPTGKEDFHHGLLSQWRAYGVDGGYAIQLSKKKLLDGIAKASGFSFQLQDVHYTPDNPLKSEVLKHSDAYIGSYKRFLENIAGPLDSNRSSMPSPLKGLPGGPLESLFDYLVHTKNQHFSEERECRLSLMEANSAELATLPTNYFNRHGLIVPYKKIKHEGLPFADCIEWIIIGPNSRMTARFKSVNQLVGASGLDIKVRPSHIPFVRG